MVLKLRDQVDEQANSKQGDGLDRTKLARLEVSGSAPIRLILYFPAATRALKIALLFIVVVVMPA